MNEAKNDAFCVFCPALPVMEADVDVRRMPLSMLRLHIAVCHVDKLEPDQRPTIYACDGNGIRGNASLCSPTKKFSTMAVNQFVDHMNREHPFQAIPFDIRYKAAISDLMTEINLRGAFNDDSLIVGLPPMDFVDQGDLRRIEALCLGAGVPKNGIDRVGSAQPKASHLRGSTAARIDRDKETLSFDSAASLIKHSTNYQTH